MLNIFTGAIPALSTAITTLSTALAPPTGMWSRLLMWFSSFIPSYGWMIIVFTIILKLIISPLDFYQRYKMRKNQAITESIKPELEALEKRHGDDKRAFQQEQMALQKKHGFSHFSACLPMILTMVIFFTLFAGMQNVTRFHEFSEYMQMHDVYQHRFLELTGFEYWLSPETGQDIDDEAAFNRYIQEWFAGGHDWVLRGENLTPVQVRTRALFESSGSQFSNARDEILSTINRAGVLTDILYGVEAPSRLPGALREGDNRIVERYRDRETGEYRYYFNLQLMQTVNNRDGADITYWTDFVISAVNQKLAALDGHPNNLPYGLPPIITSFAHLMQQYGVFAASTEARNNIAVFHQIASNAAAYRVMIAYAYGIEGLYINGVYFGEPIRTSFWWIRNIWVADTPWTRPLADYESFRNRVGDRYMGSTPPQMEDGYPMGSALHTRLRQEVFYNRITSMIRANEDLSRRNGFLLLAVLAIGLSLASQFLMRKQQKQSGQVPGAMPGMGGGLGGAAGGGMMMKVMQFIMPLMIGVFALIQSSAFALYMITNSLMTVVINLIATFIVGRIFARRDIRGDGGAGSGGGSRGRNSDGVVRHGRPDPTQINR